MGLTHTLPILSSAHLHTWHSGKKRTLSHCRCVCVTPNLLQLLLVHLIQSEPKQSQPQMQVEKAKVSTRHTSVQMTSTLFTLGAIFNATLNYSHLPTNQPQFSSKQSAEANLFTSSLFQTVLPSPLLSTTT